MKKFKTAPNGMIGLKDIDSHNEVFFKLEDVLYVSFSDRDGCSIGFRGSAFWVRVSVEDGRAILGGEAQSG